MIVTMLRVGLTGGIGAGKSAVSALLAARGAIVIDADKLAREVVLPGSPALAKIAVRFGDSVIASDGALDRPALGAIVFADTQALRDLEGITHPAIRELSDQLEAAAGPSDIVVFDNPLLIEMGQHTTCDVVIVVDVPEEVQMQRLTRLRGMSESDARARIAAQATRRQRTDVADIIVDNTGSREELARKVGGVWDQLVSRL
ncbi:dephospho-CoA kinase [soil metagenome]